MAKIFVEQQICIQKCNNIDEISWKKKMSRIVGGEVERGMKIDEHNFAVAYHVGMVWATWCYQAVGALGRGHLQTMGTFEPWAPLGERWLLDTLMGQFYLPNTSLTMILTGMQLSVMLIFHTYLMMLQVMQLWCTKHP